MTSTLPPRCGGAAAERAAPGALRRQLGRARPAPPARRRRPPRSTARPCAAAARPAARSGAARLQRVAAGVTSCSEPADSASAAALPIDQPAGRAVGATTGPSGQSRRAAAACFPHVHGEPSCGRRPRGAQRDGRRMAARAAVDREQRKRRAAAESRARRRASAREQPEGRVAVGSRRGRNARSAVRVDGVRKADRRRQRKRLLLGAGGGVAEGRAPRAATAIAAGVTFKASHALSSRSRVRRAKNGGPEVYVLDDEADVIDLTGAADGSLLAELLSAYDAAVGGGQGGEGFAHRASGKDGQDYVNGSAGSSRCRASTTRVGTSCPHHVDGTGRRRSFCSRSGSPSTSTSVQDGVHRSATTHLQRHPYFARGSSTASPTGRPPQRDIPWEVSGARRDAHRRRQ